jgi:hypothetical protein
MFPDRKPVPTPEARSTGSTHDGQTPKVLKLKAQRDTESALRIRAALRAARSDEHEGQPAEALKPAGTWIVKSLPRPPLVAAMLREPPSDELLTNDSLGG